jgi:hypothetical protein
LRLLFFIQLKKGIVEVLELLVFLFQSVEVSPTIAAMGTTSAAAATSSAIALSLLKNTSAWQVGETYRMNRIVDTYSKWLLTHR